MTVSGGSVTERAKDEVFCDDWGTFWLLREGRDELDALQIVRGLEQFNGNVSIQEVNGTLEDRGIEGIVFLVDEDGDVEAWEVEIG